MPQPSPSPRSRPVAPLGSARGPRPLVRPFSQRQSHPLLLHALIRGGLVPCALAMAATLLAAAPPAHAQDAPRPTERVISVSATGTAVAAPDRAIIATGVTTDAPTARDAMTGNANAMRKLIDGLKALRIDAKDLQTASIQLYPRYGESRGPKPPAIVGYQATSQVRVTIRDLARAGEILDQVVTLGANQMGGITFEVSNAETLKDEARKQAIVNARRRAELYAAAAGVSLGSVLAISETVAGGPQPRIVGRAAMADAVPVEPGSVDLQVQVHVTYELK